MRIGIIGSGNIGGTLTRRFTALGHEVEVANTRGPDSLRELAEETGATPATPEGAIADAELVVLAVPLKAVPDLPSLDGRLVVDANNYYPGRDGQIAEIDGGKSSSRWVADQHPGATVTKAFNTMNWRKLLADGRPHGEPGRIAIPVAGDDDAAKATVSGLVDALGFDPVDAGSLDDSRRQEPGTPVYGAELDAEQARAALAQA
jgi:8-hydroxy-5-deazaflavin:NADPH oxidoreductase